MKLLKEPFGYSADSFVKIKIYHTGSMPSKETFYDLLEFFGTYPPAMLKIYHCLKYSGQYECQLQKSWFIRCPNVLRWCFLQLNMQVTIEHVKGALENRHENDLHLKFEAPVEPKKMHQFMNKAAQRRKEETSLHRWLIKQFENDQCV
jgi:hypothetical protein